MDPRSDRRRVLEAMGRAELDDLIDEATIMRNNLRDHGPGQPYAPMPDSYANAVPMGDKQKLEHIFQYHSPGPEQNVKYVALRSAGKHFAETIMANLEPCADRTEALRMVRLAVLWANAGVALDGVSF